MKSLCNPIFLSQSDSTYTLTQVSKDLGFKSDGTIGTKMSTVITEKGREFLHNLITNNK